MSDVIHFAYRAAQQDGGLVRGSVVAASHDAAVEALAQRGLWTIELRQETAGRARGRTTRGMPIAQLALGLRILADLLEAGLPVTRTLATFDELAPAAWRTALPELRESVRQGKGLATSLGAIGAVPEEVIGIIQAGEAGSGLATAVRRAAELTEEAASTRGALRAALAYPLILVTAGTGAVALLVGIVLPRFALILADVGQTLPTTTRVVLEVAAVVRRGCVPGLLVSSLCIVLWRAMVGTAAGRLRWHRLLLRTPLLGTLRRSAATSRMCGTLSALLESGVPMAAALPHAARAAGDAALGQALMAARVSVLHGERLSRALALHHAATPTVTRLIRAGEESGRLAAMLGHGGRIEREHAVGRTKAIVRLLEPSLIVIFGGVIALVAAALLQALYSLRPGG